MVLLLRVINSNYINEVLRFRGGSKQFDFFLQYGVLINPIRRKLKGRGNVRPIKRSCGITFVLFRASITPRRSVRLCRARRAFKRFQRAPTLYGTGIVRIRVVTQGSSKGCPNVFVGVPFIRASVRVFIKCELRGRLYQRTSANFLRARSNESFRRKEDRHTCPFNRELNFRIFCLVFKRNVTFPNGTTRDASFLNDGSVVLLRRAIPFHGGKGSVAVRLCTRRCGRRTRRVNRRGTYRLSSASILTRGFPGGSIRVDRVCG